MLRANAQPVPGHSPFPPSRPRAKILAAPGGRDVRELTLSAVALLLSATERTMLTHGRTGERAAMQFESGVVLPHVGLHEPARAVRSTLLQSSLSFLRERGHFERYYALLEPQYRELIVQSMAPAWMPIEVAIEHYAACDALKLSPGEQAAIGESVGRRVQGTMISSFMRAAREAGVTPMFYLSRFDRLYQRLFQGGSTQVTRTGPKDVEVELWGARLPRFQYFRMAFTGLCRASLNFFGSRGFARQVSFLPEVDRLVISIAWV